MRSGLRHLDQTRFKHTQKTRSRQLSRGRRCSLLNTDNCWRKAKFSKISSSRDWQIRRRKQKLVDTIAMRILSIMADFQAFGRASQAIDCTEVPIFGEPQAINSGDETFEKAHLPSVFAVCNRHCFVTPLVNGKCGLNFQDKSERFKYFKAFYPPS